ncbi:MAG: tRNA (adenosine(37)-N6)-threonylcarbamoyltransferase complex transferase subunit TsaD [Rickettsiales bacterium]|jgi:N6-L-threonylcarbamoyladenine synthase|nr:tRNA (adenosine(37)-N6)-threonylcarbamoyltransferase complex transferase subunit TsaD [Rickettsiales bacterium]
MLILGIETSCDETAMAIINDRREILSHVVFSQIDIHKEFGGVVPEIAARNHLDVIDKVFALTLQRAGISARDIGAIGATAGPGLIGGVMVGTVFAKTLASILKKPFIAVNHLEGHALICRLTDNADFPFLLLLLSGGHCQIVEAAGIGRYKKLGETIDDALGECFDKVGKMLGLEYPAGAKIEELAKLGNREKFVFPLPLNNTAGRKRPKDLFNFSFSGLKTAVRIRLAREKNFAVEDVCASFQWTIVKILANRLENIFRAGILNENIREIIISGGVGANQYIKQNLKPLCEKYGYSLTTPPPELCGDNGVMIANVGLERLKLNKIDDLLITPKSRWELEELC